MSQSSGGEGDAGPQYRHLNRTKGYNTPKGFEYEYKMAGLLYVRAMNKKLDCEVFLNVDEMEPGGDIVVNIMKPRHSVICVQQKFRGKDVTLCIADFVAETGDYSIKRYYEVFQKRNKKFSQEETIKCTPEQLRMIIFTTKKKSCALNTRSIVANHRITVTEGNRNHSDEELHQEPTPTELGFNIDALFNTKRDIHAFSFGEEENKVWTLMDDKGPEEMHFYRNIFLPRFIVFSDQLSPDALDEMLKQALQERFKSLPPYRVEKLSILFLKKLKEWAEDRSETTSVGHKRGPLAAALADILRPSPEPINGQDVCFEISTLDKVLKTLRPCENQDRKRVLVLVEDVPPPLHRVKMIQALHRVFRDRWMLITDTDVRDFPAEALQFACGACDVIVIDTQDKYTVQVLLGIADNNKTSVIFIPVNTDALTGLRCMLKGWNLTQLESPWKLNQFTHKAQDAILNLEISFQGKKINLSDMEEVWPSMRSEMNGHFLGDVLQGKLTVGEAFTDVDEETPPFIDRHIEHAPIFNMSDIGEIPEEIVVALSQCPPDLVSLGSRRFRVLSESYENSSRKMEEDTFNKLCEEKPDTTFIWFRYLNDVLLQLESVRMPSRNEYQLPNILRASQRCFNMSARFEPNGRVLCQHSSSLKYITSIDTKVALLVSEPGSGKSRLFQKAVEVTRRCNPKYWSVFVRALDYGELLNSVHKQQKFCLATDDELRACMEKMLMAAAGAKDPIAQSCLRALYESGFIDIYVDGVDELCPTYKTIALQILQLLQSETKARRLWISSRPEVENDLQIILKCSVFHLLPLNPLEQNIFLQLCCGKIFSNSIPKIPEVVRLLRRLGGSLLTWPLHVWMVVKAFKNITNEDSNVPNEFDLPHLTLYRGFVEQKKQEYMKRYGLRNIENAPMVDPFKPMHQNCAMFYLVSWKLIDIPGEQFQSYIESNKEYLEKEKRGIVWLQDNIPCFIHLTLAEYFAAQWMFDNKSKSEVQSFMRKMYMTRCLEGVRRFLDYFLFENLPLHSATCTGNYEKMKSHVSEETLKAQDGLGRTAVHVAANYGNIEALKTLLGEKQYAVSPDKLKLNELHYAAAAINLEGAELLLQKGASSEHMTRLIELANTNHSLLINATLHGLLEVSRSLLQKMSEEVLVTLRPLLIRAAVAGGQHSILRLIFDLHLSLHSKQYIMGESEEQQNLTEAVVRGRKNVVEVLLEHCRDKHRSANCRGPDGTPILHLATLKGHRDVFQLLVDHGADPKAKTATEIHQIIFNPSISRPSIYKIPAGSTVAQIARLMKKKARELKKMEKIVHLLLDRHKMEKIEISYCKESRKKQKKYQNAPKENTNIGRENVFPGRINNVIYFSFNLYFIYYRLDLIRK